MSDDRAWVDRLASDLAAKVDDKGQFKGPDHEAAFKLRDGRLAFAQSRYAVFPECAGIEVRVGIHTAHAIYEPFYVFGIPAWAAAVKGRDAGALRDLIAMGIRTLLDYGRDTTSESENSRMSCTAWFE